MILLFFFLSENEIEDQMWQNGKSRDPIHNLGAKCSVIGITKWKNILTTLKNDKKWLFKFFTLKGDKNIFPNFSHQNCCIFITDISYLMFQPILNTHKITTLHVSHNILWNQAKIQNVLNIIQLLLYPIKMT